MFPLTLLYWFKTCWSVIHHWHMLYVFGFIECVYICTTMLVFQSCPDFHLIGNMMLTWMRKWEMWIFISLYTWFSQYLGPYDLSRSGNMDITFDNKLTYCSLKTLWSPAQSQTFCWTRWRRYAHFWLSFLNKEGRCLNVRVASVRLTFPICLIKHSEDVVIH